MSYTEALSEFWRKNVSSTEAIELANLLRALRKVTGHLGPNTGEVQYIGMSGGGPGAILVEPDMVMGQYPVPPAKVDYLVGLVVHEALHQIEWSDHVWTLLSPGFDQMGGLETVKFQKLVATGEDIYVDLVADKTILGSYVNQVRNVVIDGLKNRFDKTEITLDQLIFHWWAAVWEKEGENQNPPEIGDALSITQQLSHELKEISRSSVGVTARCQQRANCYSETWAALKTATADWQLIDKTLHWYPSTIKPRKIKEVFKSDTVENPVSTELIREIETQLALGSVDLTPVVKSVINSDEEAIMPTSRWDCTVAAHPMIDRQVVSRLRGVFLNYAGRRKVVSRGLSSGRLDARKLYRTFTSGRCFRQTDILPDMDWGVTLLLDASSSMRGNKWRLVENAIANLLKAFMGFHNRLQAFAYFESYGICMISQLIKDRQLLSVVPNGQTASGQALIAAAYLMNKARQRNILIHVTDGQSNFGCDVKWGIEYCQSQQVQLITLGCGNKDRDAMLAQYGRGVQFLDHFGQLPQAMERLLKWSFLYPTSPMKWQATA